MPVGGGKHCCRPYVVAVIAQILDPRPGQKVLQVGVSSGYCTAVLSEMTSHVYLIDHRPEIIDSTRARLRSIGYSSITWKSGAACKGWTEHAPYDAILVACATQQVPDDLLQQLRDGGRMIVPIGLGPEQTLTSLRKSGDTLSCKKVMTLRVDPMRCTDHSP